MARSAARWRELSTVVGVLARVAGGLAIVLLVAFAVLRLQADSAGHARSVEACRVAVEVVAADPARAHDILSAAGITADDADDVGDDCADAARVATAFDAAAVAGSGTGAYACALAATKLVQGDAPAAKKVLASARPATLEACPDTWAAAAALTADAPAESGPQSLGDAWSAFVEKDAQPLAAVGLFILLGWLALFVLARLLVELPWVRGLTSSRPARRLAGLLGWTLVVLVPVLAALVGVAAGAGIIAHGADAVVFAVIALLGMVGSSALACWLATLLRLALNVVPKAGVDVGQAQVAARFRAIASTSGIVELRATATIADVDAALTGLSTAPWVAALQKIVLFLVGVTPWSVTVEVTDDRAAAVTVARNGRIVSIRRISTTISAPAAIEPLPPYCDHAMILTTFIAAEILMQLRPAYRPDFEKGLNGATNATATALRFVAVSWYLTTAPSQAVDILRAAVAADPADRLAVASLKRAQFRRSVDVVELAGYGQWLDDAIMRMEVTP